MLGVVLHVRLISALEVRQEDLKSKGVLGYIVSCAFFLSFFFFQVWLMEGRATKWGYRMKKRNFSHSIENSLHNHSRSLKTQEVSVSEDPGWSLRGSRP